MNRIRECRLSRNMSQKYVSISLGVSAPIVSEWESGRKKPKSSNAIKLAALFGVSVEYMLGNTNEKPSTQTDDGLRNDIMDLYDSLSADQKAQAISYIRFLASQN